MSRAAHGRLFVFLFPSLLQLIVHRFFLEVGASPDYTLSVWDWEHESILLRSKAFSQVQKHFFLFYLPFFCFVWLSTSLVALQGRLFSHYWSVPGCVSCVLLACKSWSTHHKRYRSHKILGNGKDFHWSEVTGELCTVCNH